MSQAELDLIDALSDHDARRAAARSFIDDLKKTAGAKTFLMEHPEVAGAVIGGAAMAGIQAFVNMKDRHGTSYQERYTKKRQEEAELKEKQDKKEGKKRGFLSEMNRITAKPQAELATLAKKHPLKSALFTVPAGAGVGAALASAFRR